MKTLTKEAFDRASQKQKEQIDAQIREWVGGAGPNRKMGTRGWCQEKGSKAGEWYKCELLWIDKKSNKWICTVADFDMEVEWFVPDFFDFDPSKIDK